MIERRSFDYPASGRVRTGTVYRETGAGYRPVIVVVHGLLVSRDLPEIRALSERLAHHFDVVSIDLRGHGDSPGFFTWGGEEHKDLADLIAFLRRLHPSVGVVGFSMGGYISILSAALAGERVDGARPDAVCTVGAPAHLDFWRYRLRVHGLAGHLRMILRRRRRFVRPSLRGLRGPSALDLVPGVAPVPLMVVHGRRDWLVHPDHAWQLYRRAAPPREILMIEGGMHAEFIVAQDPDWLLRPLLVFFGRTLAVEKPIGSGDVEVRLNLDRS